MGRGRGRSMITAEAYDIAKRDRRWFRLKVHENMTYRDIAEADDVPVSTVHAALKRRMAAVTGVPAQEMVELEVTRLEQLYQNVRKPALSLARVVREAERNGTPFEDIQAQLEVALKCHEQARKVLADKRKMLGLEAPKQLVVSGAEGNADAARAVLLRPNGQVRDVLLEALRQPSHEWSLLLAEAGYRRAEVVESHGVAVESPTARLAAMVDDLLKDE